MIQYVVKDTVSSQNYALVMTKGRLKAVETSDAYNADPIVQDAKNSLAYWKIRVNKGRIHTESTATIQNDSIILTDADDTDNSYLLRVSRGIVNWLLEAGDFLKVGTIEILDYIHQDLEIENYMNQILEILDYMHQSLEVI